MKSLQRKLKNRKGFTLIELIVVIVILGVLAAIAIPKLSGFSDKAKESADIATAKTIATAALTYYASEGSTPGAVSDLDDYLDNADNLKTQSEGGGKDFYLVWGTGNSLEVRIENETGTLLYPAPQGESDGDGDGD